jgi:DNA-binding MarR family transcriptional regulator
LTEPAPAFDPVIHAPGRLQICAILSSVDSAEFAMLREAVKVSDSVMSKHLKQLEEAGHVALTKATEGGRQRTWIALTPTGRKAFAAHVAELQRLAAMTAPDLPGPGGRDDKAGNSP